MFGIDLISLGVGILIGAGLPLGWRAVVNTWRRNAVDKAKDVIDDIRN